MPGVGPARRAYYLHQYIESNYDKSQQKIIYELRNLAWSVETYNHKGDLPMYFTSMLIFLGLFMGSSKLLPQLTGLSPLPDFLALIAGVVSLVIAMAIGWIVGEKLVPLMYTNKLRIAADNVREKMKDAKLREWLKELKKFDQQSNSTITSLIE